VFAVEIEGVRHEFTAIPGVEEDVTAIVLNLKDLVLKIDDKSERRKAPRSRDSKARASSRPETLKLTGLRERRQSRSRNRPSQQGRPSQDDHLCRHGRGYVTSEANKIERKINTIGVISTDSNYSPVVKVAYAVEPDPGRTRQPIRQTDPRSYDERIRQTA
jgi:DNA-directed RNA polymerase subunit alpha